MDGRDLTAGGAGGREVELAAVDGELAGFGSTS
jgi:hypothetical protein